MIRSLLIAYAVLAVVTASLRELLAASHARASTR